MLTSGPRARQTCGLALHLPPPPASAFVLRSLWLGLLAVKVLERDDGATTHPWHLTSGALSFPEPSPSSPLPCHLVAFPLFVPVPAAGAGEMHFAHQGCESCKQHFPRALWPAGVSSSSKHLPAQQGRATLQPASPKQQDVANQVLRERARRAGGGLAQVVRALSAAGGQLQRRVGTLPSPPPPLLSPQALAFAARTSAGGMWGCEPGGCAAEGQLSRGGRSRSRFSAPLHCLTQMLIKFVSLSSPPSPGLLEPA